MKAVRSAWNNGCVKCRKSRFRPAHPKRFSCPCDDDGCTECDRAIAKHVMNDDASVKKYGKFQLDGARSTAQLLCCTHGSATVSGQGLLYEARTCMVLKARTRYNTNTVVITKVELLQLLLAQQVQDRSDRDDRVHAHCTTHAYDPTTRISLPRAP